MNNIHFSGQITQSRVSGLLADLQRRQGVTPSVWIDSNGGAFEFFSVYGPPLRRIGFTSIGEIVKSSAIVLFLLGYRRYALPDSQFFFHEVRAVLEHGGVIMLYDLEMAMNMLKDMEAQHHGIEEELQEFHRNMRNAQDWLMCFITERSGIPKPLLRNLMRNEVTLNAAEAVHYGIAHRIVSRDELLRI